MVAAGLATAGPATAGLVGAGMVTAGLSAGFSAWSASLVTAGVVTAGVAADFWGWPAGLVAAGSVTAGSVAAGADASTGTIGTKIAYPRVPGGTRTGIAQAGSPSAPGQTSDGIASVGGMTSSWGGPAEAASAAFGGSGCFDGRSATAPSWVDQFGTR
ncbi:hypothetical protein AB0C29_07060 [Actinoplanes sp. NPDC048791]|uniref:hypothetical protein n=1 Tax=Actinoplanes sp. NPDC048791 TaxID=3154623 RepID=UPI00340D3E63